MTRKYLLLMIIFFLFVVFFQPGCSQEKETINKGISLNEPKKPGQAGTRQSFSRGVRGEEASSLAEQGARVRKMHVKSAEVCQKEFESCIESCKKPDCEDACLEFLAACEQEVPKELQTLKQ